MIKKLSLLVLLVLVSSLAKAYDVEVDGIYYNLIKKAKAAEVTRSSNYSGDIIIPSTFDYEGTTYTVTAIDQISGAGGNKNITSVTIPNSVTSIGEFALYGTAIQTLDIPNSVTSIGKYAFGTCQLLTSVKLSNKIQEIAQNLFSQCIRLETIDIPLGVTMINKNAFYNCPALKSVTFPFGLIGIGASAFWNCKSLTSINLTTVLLIGEEAFLDCTNLNRVVFSNYLVSIYSKAFSNCKDLTDVYCYRDSVLSTNLISSDAFLGSQVKYATLHVLEPLINQYKKTKPWSEFGTIVPITDEESGISDIRANEILVRLEGNCLTIHGAKENEHVVVYNLSGRQVGSGVVRNNTATITTNLRGNEIVIVKIGNKVIKVAPAR